MTSALLRAYLARIGVPEAGPPTLQTLRHLHGAHAGAIPFENLDVLLGLGIPLEIERVHDKLVARRRGGYCFEQNTLFLDVLRTVGFRAEPMEARVRAGSTALLPRTHMVIVVTIRGTRWLADVGFGGEGPREPVRLDGEATPETAGVAHRVVQESGLHVLQARRVLDPRWADQYAFGLQPVHPVDLEVANWYTSTHPGSRFLHTLTAQRAAPEQRLVLRYPELTEIDAGGVRTRTVARADLVTVLRERFGIDVPEDTRFPVIDEVPQVQPAPGSGSRRRGVRVARGHHARR